MSDLINRIYGDFNKKNEMPKVKISKFATGGTCNDAIFPKLDAFSQIDEIVKDITKKKDDAIAMEFTKRIGELLKKNGVTPKITEYTHESVKEHSIEQLYGVSIDELDFSEHDKVFEDKIAKLERQIDRLNEEKSFLRTRCMPYVEKDFDNRLYGKLAIVSCNEEFVDIGKYADGDDLYSREVRNLISEGGIKRLIGQYRNLSSRLDKMSDENKGLKQRIAELESKNESLNQSINEITTSRSEWIDKAVEWQQKCEKLEGEETETCEKETKVSDSAPSIEWYENRHQSDCIEINRLNTTIDVLIHKVEYLRQFAGLE